MRCPICGRKPPMKLQLIDNWRKGWKLWSVRFSFLGMVTQFLALADWGAVLGIWNMMPVPVRVMFPGQFMSIISAVLFGAAMIARFIPQPKAMPERPDANA